MAHVPIVAAGFREDDQSDTANVSFQRSDACADQRSGGRLFRKSVWNYVPGPTTQRSCCASARSIAFDAGWPGRPHYRLHFPWFVSDTFPFVVRSGDISIDGIAAGFGAESG